MRGEVAALSIVTRARAITRSLTAGVKADPRRVVILIRIAAVLVWLGMCVALLPAAMRPQDPDVHVGPRLVFMLMSVGGLVALVIPSIIIVIAVIRRWRYAAQLAAALDFVSVVILAGVLEYYPWLPLLYVVECALLFASSPPTAAAQADDHLE